MSQLEASSGGGADNGRDGEGGGEGDEEGGPVASASRPGVGRKGEGGLQSVGEVSGFDQVWTFRAHMTIPRCGEDVHSSLSTDLPRRWAERVSFHTFSFPYFLISILSPFHTFSFPYFLRLAHRHEGPQQAEAEEPCHQPAALPVSRRGERRGIAFHTLSEQL